MEGNRPSLVPLTLLYTSLLPLLLQLFLSIWYSPGPSSHEPLPATSHMSIISTLPQRIISLFPSDHLNIVTELEGELNRAWNGADRVWAGTRLLGGMSAGFGLRVLLPTKPWETTGIVLAGWVAAAFVGRMLGAARRSPDRFLPG